MSRNALTMVIAVALLVYGVYIASYLPGLLVGSPPTAILIGFLAQAVTAFLGAAGTWWARSWAPIAILCLGAAIVATEIIEAFVYGIIAHNRAVGVSLLGLALTIIAAILVSRSGMGTRLRAIE